MLLVGDVPSIRVDVRVWWVFQVGCFYKNLLIRDGKLVEDDGDLVGVRASGVGVEKDWFGHDGGGSGGTY